MNKWRIRGPVMTFAILSAIGALFMAFELTKDVEVPKVVALTVLPVQTFVLTMLLGVIGLKWMKRTTVLRLERFPEQRKRAVGFSVLCGVGVGWFVWAADALVFARLISEVGDYEARASLAGLIGGVLYGGIAEEVMLRLFLMSGLVLLFSRLSKRESLVYVSAILVSGVLFALAHLPANAALFGGLDVLIVVRALVLNMTGGFVFGYLYWRYGLYGAMVAHMASHVSMQWLLL